MAQHTPGPWRVDYVTSLTSQYPIILPYNRSLSKIAEVFSPITGMMEEAEANAAFIVRACNSHAELLEACKEIESACREYGIPDGDFSPARFAEAINSIRQAIVKATKGE